MLRRVPYPGCLGMGMTFGSATRPVAGSFVCRKALLALQVVVLALVAYGENRDDVAVLDFEESDIP